MRQDTLRHRLAAVAVSALEAVGAAVDRWLGSPDVEARMRRAGAWMQRHGVRILRGEARRCLRHGDRAGAREALGHARTLTGHRPTRAFPRRPAAPARP